MNELKFALTEVPHLYKMRSYDTPERKRRLKDLLGGELYFATRPELNDPFEMTMVFRFGDDRRKARKRIYDFHREDGGVKGGPAKRLEVARRTAARLENNPEIFDEAERKHRERMDKECFIFCMSENREHPLLWSHYADSHKGVCIRFDAKSFPFSGASRVVYSDALPVLGWPFDNPGELAQAAILTKAKFWEYEAEFRLFSVRMENPSWSLGLSWKSDHVATVPRDTITGLTIGAAMPKEDADELIDHVKSGFPHISVERAQLREKEYGLRFEPA